MNLRYTPQAMLDLQEIEDYISVELQNPDAARHIITSIARGASRLKDNPCLGFDLSAKTGREIRGRGLVSGKNLLIYNIDDCVSVLRVLDTRVDYLRMIGTWQRHLPKIVCAPPCATPLIARRDAVMKGV